MMEVNIAVIVSVVMAALCVNTFAAYTKPFAHTALPYSQVDSSEQTSSESTYPATHDPYVLASATYSNSEEDSTHSRDEEEEKDANIDSRIEYPAYKEADYVTTSYPIHVYEDPAGYSTVSYTSSVAYPVPLNNDQYVVTTYPTPDYSTSAYAAPTLDVPVYRAPAILPYWMRSGHQGNTIESNPSY